MATEYVKSVKKKGGDLLVDITKDLTFEWETEKWETAKWPRAQGGGKFTPQATFLFAISEPFVINGRKLNISQKLP